MPHATAHRHLGRFRQDQTFFLLEAPNFRLEGAHNGDGTAVESRLVANFVVDALHQCGVPAPESDELIQENTARHQGAIGRQAQHRRHLRVVQAANDFLVRYRHHSTSSHIGIVVVAGRIMVVSVLANLRERFLLQQRQVLHALLGGGDARQDFAEQKAQIVARGTGRRDLRRGGDQVDKGRDLQLHHAPVVVVVAAVLVGAVAVGVVAWIPQYS